MPKTKETGEYFLQVIKEGEEPTWPHPEDELVVGHQALPSGYTQYWAYAKESGKEAQNLPNAEEIAADHPTSSAVILVDQPDYLTEKGEHLLELILAKDGHAWGKSESTLANLEDNLSSILEFAKDQFNINVEHFMTTKNVSKEVEKILDNLEEKEEIIPEAPSPAVGDHPGIRQVNTQPMAIGLGGGNRLASGYNNRPSSSGKGPSKLVLLIPVVVLLLVGGSIVLFKDKFSFILGREGNPAVSVTPTPSPIPTPTVTPTPAFDRSQAQVRILNGTTKTGAAATLGKKLEGLGWKILETGNASKKGVLKTEIHIKEGSQAASTALASDLSSDYQASVSATLKKSDKADLEVVIGEE